MMPQVGDVWLHNGHRRHVRAVTETYIEFDYRTTPGAQPGDFYRLSPQIFLEQSTLVERDGKAVAK
jgi:hypothetical protein